jgi:hypothetical protein
VPWNVWLEELDFLGSLRLRLRIGAVEGALVLVLGGVFVQEALPGGSGEHPALFRGPRRFSVAEVLMNEKPLPRFTDYTGTEIAKLFGRCVQRQDLLEKIDPRQPARE